MSIYIITGVLTIICISHLVQILKNDSPKRNNSAKGNDGMFFEDSPHFQKHGLRNSDIDHESMHYDPTNPYHTERIAPLPSAGDHGGDIMGGESFGAGMHDSSFGAGMHDAGGGLSDPFSPHQ